MIIQKWKQCDAFVIGTSHIERNEVCQDRTYSLTDNGVTVIALADGAGSKKNSHIGAELVTKLICQIMVDHFDEYLLLLEKVGIQMNRKIQNQNILKKLILDQLVDALNDHGITNNIPFVELSSTLLFYAYKNGFSMFGHIGDGVIGIIKDSNKSVEVLSLPENGAQPNITYFLTDNDAINHFRVEGAFNPNIMGVILMSDGTADLLFNKKNGFNDNTIKILENYSLQKKSNYKNTLELFLKQIVSKYSDDDLSLNILYKESFSTKTLQDDTYLDDLFSGISSKNQIDFITVNSVLLRPELTPESTDFDSIDDIKEYLEW